MCLKKKQDKVIKQIIENENKFIFRVLSKTIKDFNRCYICNKETTTEDFNLLRLPTEHDTICLCSKCAKQFRRQAKVHKKIFIKRDKQILHKVKKNEIALPDLFNSQFLQLSFAHKFWLDKQRRINAERRNKGKD